MARLPLGKKDDSSRCLPTGEAMPLSILSSHKRSALWLQEKNGKIARKDRREPHFSSAPTLPHRRRPAAVAGRASFSHRPGGSTGIRGGAVRHINATSSGEMP
jgi:hypothetical protein